MLLFSVFQNVAQNPDSFSTRNGFGSGIVTLPADTCFYDGICEGGCFVMTAGFQRYIDRGAFWRLAAGNIAFPLCGQVLHISRHFLANDTAVFLRSAPTTGCALSQSSPLLRQLNGYGHIFFVFTVNSVFKLLASRFLSRRLIIDTSLMHPAICMASKNALDPIVCSQAFFLCKKMGSLIIFK